MKTTFERRAVANTTTVTAASAQALATAFTASVVKGLAKLGKEGIYEALEEGGVAGDIIRNAMYAACPGDKDDPEPFRAMIREFGEAFNNSTFKKY